MILYREAISLLTSVSTLMNVAEEYCSHEQSRQKAEEDTRVSSGIVCVREVERGGQEGTGRGAAPGLTVAVGHTDSRVARFPSVSTLKQLSRASVDAYLVDGCDGLAVDDQTGHRTRALGQLELG